MIDINYIKITKFDTSNGPGIRTVLWVAGCSHHCQGCHNKETWDPTKGKIFTQQTIEDILDTLDSKYVSGITISGGDPLYKDNIDCVLSLILQIREEYPDKSIWVYTGYTYEEILYLTITDRTDNIWNILRNIDVLVDGRFIEGKRNIKLPYCGSTNQRVIDMKKTLEEEEVVLYKNRTW